MLQALLTAAMWFAPAIAVAIGVTLGLLVLVGLFGTYRDSDSPDIW